MQTIWKFLGLVVAVTAVGIWLVKPTASVADPDGDHEDEKAAHAHVHVPAPLPYADMHMPPGAWTDATLIARGKEIYATKCAVCHGDAGDGKGPAGAALPLKPPDLRDRHAIDEMRDNYWFWRGSEGGSVDPFKS